MIPLPHGYTRLLLIIKIIRILNGFKLFQVRKIINIVRYFFDQKVKRIIESDPVKAEDINSDNNNISVIIKFNNLLKILKLVLVILFMSYFVGFFFTIASNLQTDLQNYIITPQKNNMTDVEFEEWASPYNLVTFFSKFELFYEDDENLTEEQNESLEEIKDLHNSIKVVYFAFTSLSTVGFGDLRPESDFERLLGSAILLGGVAVFSYFMSIFIIILDQHKVFKSEFDQGEELYKFFVHLGYYNNNRPMNLQLKKDIE